MRERPLDLVSIGGGPAGLYFGILMKLQDPRHRVRIYERNRLDDTFGFGVVFSDATLGNLASADAETYRQITESFAHWDDIDVHFGGRRFKSRGHGFSGMSRKRLLSILAERAKDVGVELIFETEVKNFEELLGADLVLAADGANSMVRDRWAEHFGPTVDMRPNRFVWLGTTRPFEAFTFYFKANAHGLFRVHAYRYEPEHSTFIVECTEATWKKAGLDRAREEDTVAYIAELFAEELKGHPLITNRSLWRSFPTISNERWHHENVVLMGDAAHTAHFSIGSGTKLAMEDSIALAHALKSGTIPEALDAYERERRPEVESTQRAAQTSLEWFENTERYLGLAPIQFAFSLLTRSLRITHDNLRVRDEEFTNEVDGWFAERAGVARAVPPMFTPFSLRDLKLENRVVVSPMCMYSATDGAVNDWHFVHLGSRAIGGAGLIMTEMTDVSAEGRITPGCAGMYTDGHVKEWRRIVDFVHAQSTAKIGLQIAHAGRKGATCVPWEGADEPLPSAQWPLIAASAVPYLPHSRVPREMTRADMERVTADFARAAQRADEAGFDLIELHFAHGYLLASFISPLTNRRTDAYGGSLENRLRFPVEVLTAVRSVWPEHKPISVRISATDWDPEGTQPEDAVQTARVLAKNGCDIVDVSAGQTVPEAKPVYGRLYQTPFSERIRLEAGVPTMTVGNISSYADVNSILAAGRADLCVLARAHLYDPYWTRHAAAEQGYALPWPKPYATLDRYTFRFK